MAFNIVQKQFWLTQIIGYSIKSVFPGILNILEFGKID